MSRETETETRRRPHKNYPKVLVAWMRDKIPSEGDFTTFINENDQAGGFKYSIIDYEPDDPENWVKLYITTEDPALITNGVPHPTGKTEIPHERGSAQRIVLMR